MPDAPTNPGVYVQEMRSGVRTITAVATSITAFIGNASRGPVNEPTAINNFGDYERLFGGLDKDSTMSYAVRDFFQSGGSHSIIVRIANVSTEDYLGDQDQKTGLYALDKVELFNLLCIPPPDRDLNTDVKVYVAAMDYCAGRRGMLIVDPDADWGARPEAATSKTLDGVRTMRVMGISGPNSRNAAIFVPRIVQIDPRLENQLDTFVACGMIAGIMARTDSQHGVWKAAAGLDATLGAVSALQVKFTDDENGQLNPQGVNCLRSLPGNSNVIWGSRTLSGADALADEYKYIPVRRTALMIEESLYQETQWVVFEPNDEPLWAQIRFSVGGFMQNLFRQGAFQGQTPHDAYLVKCDSETTTQNDINQGIVNIVVGFAPLKPAEFVIINIQQLAGCAATRGC